MGNLEFLSALIRSERSLADDFLTLSWHFRKEPDDIKVGVDSLDFVIDMWWEESLDIVLVRLFVGTRYEIPSETRIRQL